MWTTDFDKMAKKTICKLHLSSDAPLEVKNQIIDSGDQAVILGDNKFKYIDNTDDNDGEKDKVAGMFTEFIEEEPIAENNIPVQNKYLINKTMKHKFQNAKIVGENSKENQEILFGLGYRWKIKGILVSMLESPFLFIDSDGIISYENNNKFFYEHENILITLDTLKQWQMENIELVEGEFYYGYETKEKHASIFQYKI